MCSGWMDAEADLIRSHSGASGHRVFECPDSFDGDANDVAAGEGEVVCGYDSCAGHGGRRHWESCCHGTRYSASTLGSRFNSAR